jgi:hypothetical protein
MKNRKFGNIGVVVIMTALLSSAGGLAVAGESTPMTPELAAKREMVRKQQEQRITPAKRKAAAEALKAERIKVHKAKQGEQPPPPANPDNK